MMSVSSLFIFALCMFIDQVGRGGERQLSGRIGLAAIRCSQVIEMRDGI